MMVKRMLTYMVVDDDKEVIKLITSYGERMPQLQLAATETNSVRALRYLYKSPVDLLIADIDMPDMSGIELVQALQPAPLVILVTAHERFAIKGFDIEAVDFILKPPPFERFARAVNRASAAADMSSALSSALLQPVWQGRDYVYLRSDGAYQRIDFSNICFIEADGNDIRIKLVEERIIRCRMTLQAIMMQLPPQDFVQVHRSFIIHLRLVASIFPKRKIQMIGTPRKIPIGEFYYQGFMRIWKQIGGDY